MLGPLASVLLTVAILVGLAGAVGLLRGVDRDGTGPSDQHAGETRSTEEGGDAGARPVYEAPVTSDTDGRIACKHCGTTNDPAYTYCQRCVTRL